MLRDGSIWLCEVCFWTEPTDGDTTDMMTADTGIDNETERLLEDISRELSGRRS